MTTATTITELRSTLLQVPWNGPPPAAGVVPPGPRELYVLEIETQGGLVGMSYLHPEVPSELRGTYAGMACEPIIKHLQNLGITALERDMGERIQNAHFEEQVEGETMTFDYVLRPGVVRSSNALRLMRAVGIDVPDDSRLTE